MEQKRILVIDDEVNIRSAIKRMIEENLTNIDVIGAGKSEDAIKAINKFKPELILLDLMMPEMNGLQILNYLKKNKNPLVKKIPVVMLTAIGNNEIALKSKKMGAIDYITKPFDEKLFLLKLRKLLNLSYSSMRAKEL